MLVQVAAATRGGWYTLAPIHTHLSERAVARIAAADVVARADPRRCRDQTRGVTTGANIGAGAGGAEAGAILLRVTTANLRLGVAAAPYTATIPALGVAQAANSGQGAATWGRFTSLSTAGA